MKETMLHTPEGVRDIYNEECRERQAVISRIHEVLHLHGNQDIQTPTFEYFNIFNQETGSAPSHEMYKFFDRNNNTLVLRPDLTPSIARCVAKYFPKEDLPLRLCYLGNTFLNRPQHQGKLSETTQIGCELINDDSSAADAEMIAAVIDCLKAAGLHDFQIEIGEVEYFKGLVEEAGLSSQREEKIRNLIQIKNFFGLSEYVDSLPIPDSVRTIFNRYDTLFGDAEMLEGAEKLAENPRSRGAVQRLQKVYKALSYYGCADYVSFDLSMINGYDYYTGIVFSAYTYGTGNPVARGGRYNDLLKKFGKDAPSIGFAIQIDELMNARSRQKISFEDRRPAAMVVYTMDFQETAVHLSALLRSHNIAVSLIRKSKRHTDEEYETFVSAQGTSRLYLLEQPEIIQVREEDGTEHILKNLAEVEESLA